MRAVFRAAALTCSLAACVDFGYVIDPPPPELDAGRDGSSSLGDGCVEGPAEPSSTGPQIGYAPLDVSARSLRVQAGDVVTWTNASGMPHTATAGAPGANISAEAGGFDSGVIAGTGGVFAWRFCTPREIEWYCRTHSAQMFGYVIVVE